jgi:hypothetical protein
MKFACALVSFGLGAICAAQAPPDSRFDGIWVGTETLTPTAKINADEQKRIPGPHRTTIAIAKGATMVGIIDGVCPGRYQQIRRGGNTLTFSAADCHLTVTLSADGKTLTEQGNCNRPTMWAVRMGVGSGVWPVTWVPLRINGTFHRQ